MEIWIRILCFEPEQVNQIKEEDSNQNSKNVLYVRPNHLNKIIKYNFNYISLIVSARFHFCNKKVSENRKSEKESLTLI